MKRFYIALLDNCFQDMRSAIGPFTTAEKASRWYKTLVNDAATVCMSGPSEPAAIGDWFALEINCTPEGYKNDQSFGLSTVLGPFKSRSAATRAMNREMEENGDATFLRSGEHFVAPVRYVKTRRKTRLQVAIFERA